jgi:predicted secreted hydrolase
MRFAACLVLLLCCVSASAAVPDYPQVRPGIALQFPRDHGAHPDFRTEWWYITGWLDSADGPVGFQVTFFRTRPELDEDNPSRFAPKQILFAHAALSDAKLGHLLHDQRTARAGFGIAEASENDADIVLQDWSLKRGSDGRFITRVRAAGFTFDFAFAPTQAVLPEGENGYSRKGPAPEQASHYYSVPQLAVSGTLTRGGRNMAVTGQAWMDREWSSAYLDPRAVGWDWLGLNLEGGGALMAFQIRDAQGGALWAGGSLREGNGALTVLGKDDVRLTPERVWRSPRTGTSYPVARVLTLRVAGREQRYRIRPLFDDQELDSRRGGGPVYWEGAVEVDGAARGRGYLELTGYFRPLKL